MSWAQEEWKDGLNQKALLKITQIENQNEKFKKETKQKQFQLDSLEAAFNKQKKKLDDDKTEIAALKRENQGLGESCSKFEQKIDKLNHELRNKETHVNSIEGRMQRCKTQLDALTSKTPKHHRDEGGSEKVALVMSKLSEAEGRLMQEKAQNQKLEKELNELKSKSSKPSYKSLLPWATDDVTSPVEPARPPTVVDLLTGSPLAAGGGDALISLLSDPLHQRQQNNTEEASKIKSELSAEMKELRSKLFEKEKTIGKKADEITSLRLQLEEVTGKVVEFERKAKQAMEELKCERHNSESSRSSLQSKLQDEEKRRLQEASEAQDIIRTLDKQLKEMKTNMSQNLAQNESDLRRIQSDLGRSEASLDKVKDELKKTQQKVVQMEQLHQSDSKKISDLNSSLKAVTLEKDKFCFDLQRTENKLMELEKNQESLKRDLQASRNQLTGTKQGLVQKEQELGALKEKTDKASRTMEMKIDNLSLKTSDLESRISQAGDLIKKKDREISELQTKIEQLRSGSLASERKLDQIREECADLDKEKRFLAEKHEAMKNRLDKTERSLQQVESAHVVEVFKLKEQLELESASCKKKIKSCEDLKQEKIVSLIKKQELNVLEFEKKIEEQNELLNNLSLETKNKEKRLKDVERDLKDVESASEKAQDLNRSLLAQTDKLKCELAGSQEQTCDLEARLKTSLYDLEEVEVSKKSLEEKHRATIEELRANVIERSSLEGRVQDLEEQVEQLKSDEESMKRLTSQILESSQREKCLAEKFSAAELLYQQLQERLCSLKKENQSLHSDLTAVAQEKENAISELKEVTSSIETRICEYDKKISSKSQDLETLQQSHDVLISDYETLVKEVAGLKDVELSLREGERNALEKFDQLGQLHKQEESRIHELEDELLKRSETLNNFQNSLKAKVAENEILSNLQMKLREAHDNLLSRHDGAQQEIVNLHKEAASLRESLRQSIVDNDKLSLELQDLVEKCKLTEAQNCGAVHEKDKEVSMLTEIRHQLEADVNSLTKELEKSFKEKQLYLQESDELRSKVSSLDMLLQNKTARNEELVENLSTSLKEEQNKSSDLYLEVESLKLSLEEVTSEKDNAYDLADARLSSLHVANEKIESLQEELLVLGRSHQSALSSITEEQKIRDQMNEKIQLLNQDIERKNAEILDIIKKSEEISAQLHKVKEAHNRIAEEQRNEKDTFEATFSKFKTLQEDLKEKDLKITKLCSALEENEATMVTRLENVDIIKNELNDDLKDLSDKLSYANDVIEAKETSIAELRKSVESLQTERLKLSGNLELMQMDMEDKDDVVTSLQSQIVPNLEAKVAEKNSAIEKLTKEVVELELRLTSSSQVQHDAEEESMSLSAQLKQKTIDLGNGKRTCEILRTELSVMKESQAALERTVEGLEASLKHEKLSNNQLNECFEISAHKLLQQTMLVDELKPKLKCSEEKCEKLEEELAKLSAEKIEIDETLSSKTTEFEEFSNLTLSLKTALDDLKKTSSNKHDELEKELKSYKKECNELREETEMLQTSLSEAEMKAENMAALYDRISLDNTQLRDEVSELAQEITTASRTLMDLEGQLDEAEAKLESEKKANDVLTTSMLSEKRELCDEVNKLENEVKSLVAELETKSKTCQELQEDFDEMQLQCTNLKERNEELDGLLIQAKSDCDNTIHDVTELKTLMDSLQSEVQAKDAELQKNSARIVDVTTMLDEEAKRKSDISVSLQEEINRLSNRLDMEMQEKLFIDNELKELKETERLLRHSKEEQEVAVAALEGKCREEETVAAQLQEENHHLQEVISNTEKTLGELKMSSDDVITSLKETVSKTEEELKEVLEEKLTNDSALEEAKLQAKILESEVALTSTRIVNAMRRLDDKIAENEELLDRFNELSSNNEELEMKFNQLQEKSAEAAESLESQMQINEENSSSLILKLQSDISNLLNDKENFNSQLCSLEKALSEKHEKISDLETQLVDSCAEVSNAKMLCDELSLENDTLKVDVCEHIASLTALQSEKNSALQEKESLQSYLDEMKISHSTLNNSLIEEIDDLKLKLEEVSRSLSIATEDSNQKEIDNGNLRRKVNEDFQSLEAQANALEKVNRKHEDALQELNLLQEQNHSLDDELTQALKEVEILKEAEVQLSADFNIKVASLTDLVEELKVELETSKSDFDKVSDELSSLIQNFQEKESEVVKLTHQLHEIKDELVVQKSKDKQEIDDLQKEIETLSSSLDNRNDELQENATLVVQLKADIDAESAQNAEALKHFYDAQAAIESDRNRLQLRLQSVTTSNDELQMKLETNLEETKRQETVNSRIIVTEQKKVVELLHKYDEVSLQFREISDENASLQHSVSQLSRDFTSQGEDLEAERAKHRSLLEENQSLDNELKKLHLVIVETKDENDNLTERIYSLVENYKISESQRFQLEAEVRGLKGTISQLEDQLEALGKQNSLNVVSMEDKIKQLEDGIVIMESQHKTSLERKGEAINQLQTANEELRSCADDVKYECIGAEREVETLKEKLSCASEELEKLKKECDDLNAKLFKLREDATSKESELSSAMEEISLRDNEINEIKNRFSTIQDAHAATIQESDLKLTCLENELAHIRSEQTSTVGLLNAADASCDVYSAKVEELEEVLQKLNKNLLQKNSQLEDAENQVKKLQEENSSSENEAARSKLFAEEMSEQFRAMEQELLSIRLHRDNRVDELKLQLSANVDEVATQRCSRDDMEAEVIRYSEKVSNLRSEVAVKEDKLKASLLMIDKLQEAQREHADAAALSEKELHQMRHELDMELSGKQSKILQLETLIDSNQCEVVTLEEKIAQLEEALGDKDEKQQEVETLKEQLSVITGRFEILEAKHLDLTEKFCQLQNDASVSVAALSTALNDVSLKDKEIKEHKETITRLHCEISSLGDENKEIAILKDELSARDDLALKTKATNLLESSSQTDHITVAELEEKLNRIDLKFQETLAELESAQSRVGILLEAKETLESKAEEAELVMAEMSNQILTREDKLVEVCGKHERELEELRLKLSDNDEELVMLRCTQKQIEAQASRYSEEVSNLRSEVAVKEDKLKASLLMIDKLQEAQREHADAAALSEKELHQLRREHELEMKKKHEEIAQLEDAVDSKQAEFSNLQDRASELQFLLDDVEGQLRRIKSDFEETDSSREIALVTLEERNEELNRARNVHEELVVEKSSLESRLSEHVTMIKSLEEELETVRSTKDEEYKSLESEWREVEATNMDLSSENNMLTEQMKMKEKQAKELQEKLAVMETVLADTSLTNTQVTNQLKDLNDVINQEAARHKKKIRQMESDNENVMASFTSLKRVAETLKQRNNEISRDLMESTERIESLHEEENRLQAETLSLKESNSSLEERHCRLDARIREMEASLEEAESTIEQMTFQQDDMTEKQKDADNLLEEMSLAMEALRVSLQDERDKVQDQQHTYACSETKSRDTIDALRREADSLRQQLSDSERDKSVHVNEIIDRYEAKEAEIKRHSDKVLQDFEVLNAEVRDMEERNNTLSSEVHYLRTSIQETEQCHQEEKDAASSKLKAVWRDLEKLRCEIDCSEAEKKRAEEQSLVLEKEVSELSEEVASLKSLGSTNLKLKKEVDSMKGKLQLMTTTARHKEKELHRAMRMLADRKPGSHSSVIKQAPPESDSGSLASASSNSSATTRRSRPKRLSRKSAKLEKAALAENLPVSKDGSPKKSRLSDEAQTSCSASPVFQVEGLPHLVNKGFTNIPLGFSSPFVVRRQQLSETKQLVAAAMAKKNQSASSRDINDNEDECLDDQKEQGNPVETLMNLRSRSKKALPHSKSHQPPGGVVEPLQTVTNSPKRSCVTKPPRSSSDGSRKLRLGLTKSPDASSQAGGEEEADCKVQ